MGAVCNITNIQSNQSVVAQFTSNSYTVSGTASPAAGGSVTCQGPVAYGSSSTCTATPNTGYALVGFSGACTGSTCQITNIQSNASVTAQFALRVIVSQSSSGAMVTAVLRTASAACEFDAAATGPFTPTAVYEGGSSFAQGGFKFRVQNCQLGEAVQVAVTFPDLTGMTARKFGPTPNSPSQSVWYLPDGLVVTGNTLTYTVTDGGLGDDNFVADGAINDPIIPVPAATTPPEVTTPTPVPSLSQWSAALLSVILLVMAGRGNLARKTKTRRSND